ncbi:MAG: DegT/DnrJ/EryC1/StrS family aminotransferase [Lachnospiraceae bacterium]|nr:DegT/DnrJ/EryC1/StrS family aminotransferase [Lachnospiraceae bacterium]
MMKSENKRDGILRGLAELSAGPFYPMHMPGHKRKNPGNNALPYGIDITEIEGFDDLHHAGGMIKAAMDRAGRLYGSEKTWFLTCGATCGILAAIGAVTKHNDRIIIARNCHISVFHAVEIKCLGTFYAIPEYNDEYDILGSVSPSTVLEAVRSCPGAKAVVITSPTYEGVISDIKEISRICHEHGIPLIVDEAHGAHLSFYGSGGGSFGSASDDSGKAGGSCTDTPYGSGKSGALFAGLSDLSALKAGADIVIDSVHKTLPALTQSAFLHLRSWEYVNEAQIEEQLSIYETSSPSYVLMASMDECVDVLEKKGGRLFSEYERRLERFSDGLKEIKRLKVLMFAGTLKPGAGKNRKEGIFAKDPGRILINGRKAGLTGSALSMILRERYHIETEMSAGFNTLALTSACDTEEGFDRLLQALTEIDRNLSENILKEENLKEENLKKEDLKKSRICTKEGAYEIFREIYEGKAGYKAALTITGALEAESRTISYREAPGQTAAEYIYLYPPGIPVIVPGERITEKLAGFLSKNDPLLRKSRTGDRRGEITVTTGQGSP